MKFQIGKLVATPAVLEAVPQDEIFAALSRHVKCDWGNLCAEDWLLNNAALHSSQRLFSVYHSAEGVKFYIITEADRSSTTVLLPEDY